MSLENIEEKYLEMTDNDIDRLLLGVNLDETINTENVEVSHKCNSCQSENLVIDQNGQSTCKDCGVVNSELYDENNENIDRDNINELDTLILLISIHKLIFEQNKFYVTFLSQISIRYKI